jgi:hypothetical protein
MFALLKALAQNDVTGLGADITALLGPSSSEQPAFDNVMARMG